MAGKSLYPPEKKEQMRELMRRGMGTPDIAVEIEVPYDTVIKWVRAEYRRTPKVTRRTIVQRLNYMLENAATWGDAQRIIHLMDKYLPPDEEETNVHTAERMREAADAAQRAAADRSANGESA